MGYFMVIQTECHIFRLMDTGSGTSQLELRCIWNFQAYTSIADFGGEYGFEIGNHLIFASRIP